MSDLDNLEKNKSQSTYENINTENDALFGIFNPEDQKIKEAKIAEKIAAEEALENDDIIDLEYGSTAFDENSTVSQNIIDSKIEKTQDEKFSLKETEETYYPGLSNGTNTDTSVHFSEDIKEITDSDIIGETETSIDKQEKFIDHSDNKYFPVLESLVSGQIATSIIGLCIGDIGITKAIDIYFASEDAKKVNGLTDEQRDQTKNKIEKLTEKGNELENIQTFNSNNKDLVKEIGKNENEKYQHVLSMVAKHYVPIENQQGGINNKESLNISFDTTVNDILKDKVNHNKETEQLLILNIQKSNSVEEKLENLLLLNNLVTGGENIGAKINNTLIAKNRLTEDKNNKKLNNHKDDIIKRIQDNNIEDPKKQEELKEATKDLYDDDKKVSLSDIEKINDEVSEIIGETIKEG